MDVYVLYDGHRFRTILNTVDHNILYGLYNKYLVGIPYTRIAIYIVAIGLVGKNKQVVKIKGEKK